MTSTTERPTELSASGHADLLARYESVRGLTEALAEPLCPEDQVVQSMPDVSPTKWHRAHVTWFFETFVLGPEEASYEAYDPAFGHLFNSYYEQVGEYFPRSRRGLISRPTVAEVGAYRRHVDDAMRRLLDRMDEPASSRIAGLVSLGLNHEQQHQELMLMDIKHVLSCSPTDPVYVPSAVAPVGVPAPQPVDRRDPPRWIEFEGGVIEIGHAGDGFAYDNEGPRHRVHLEDFRIAHRLVTCGDWLEFIEDGGYSDPTLWLSDGWWTVKELGWDSPLYWRRETDGWSQFTLHGRRPVVDAEPVVHVSHYEADAFARWAGARLATEAEWEHAATSAAAASDDEADPDATSRTRLHPRPAAGGGAIAQMSSEVWEWTSSAYLPYPGYQPPVGAIGEYNAKFMSGQMVLRGGSCVTPPGHSRPTYRNFFPPASRWAFSGLRLANDA